MATAVTTHRPIRVSEASDVPRQPRTEPLLSLSARVLGAGLALFCTLAHADAPPAPETARAQLIERLWNELSTTLAQASDALVPPLAPPQPVAVRWQARRISSVDLAAPLLALEAVDLDGDRRAEIIALTTRELVIVERASRRKLAVRARALLPTAQPALRPRAPVGTMTVVDIDGDGVPEVSVRASERARGAVYRFLEGALVEVTQLDGFPLCARTFARLEPGRNYFATATRNQAPGSLAAPKAQTLGVADVAGAATAPAPGPLASAADRAFSSELPAPFFAARCRDDLVDPVGRPVSAVGVVGTDGTLHLWADRSCPPGDGACLQNRISTRKLADRGVAFALADIDNDGHPEVVVTADSAPGEADRVTVLSWRGNRLPRLFQRSFSGGVVGLAAGDIDGNGSQEILAAVRLWGSRRVDMWILNR